MIYFPAGPFPANFQSKEDKLMHSDKCLSILFVNNNLDEIKIPTTVSLYLTAEISCRRKAVIREIIFSIEGTTDPYECKKQMRKVLKKKEWFKEEEACDCHIGKFADIRVTGVGYIRGLTGERKERSQKKSGGKISRLSLPKI